MEQYSNEQLDNIFKQLELKKQLIIKYEELFKELEKSKNNYPSKVFNKLSKNLYKQFKIELKNIETNIN